MPTLAESGVGLALRRASRRRWAFEPARWRIGFQRWIVGTVLGVAFLCMAVFSQLELKAIAQAEDQTALQLLGSVANQARDSWVDVLEEKLRFVTAVSESAADPRREAAVLDSVALTDAMRTTRGVRASVVAWTNGNYQVVDLGMAMAKPPPDLAGVDYLVLRTHQDAAGKPLHTLSWYSRGHVLLRRVEGPGNAGYLERDWYQSAMLSQDKVVTHPYPVPGISGGMRIAVAAPLARRQGVVSASEGLADMEAALRAIPLDAGVVVLVLDDAHNVLAVHGDSRGLLVRRPAAGQPGLLATPDNTGLSQLGQDASTSRTERSDRLELAGVPYLRVSRDFQLGAHARYQVQVLAPAGDFGSSLDASRNRVWIGALGALLLVVPLTWVATRRVTLTLGALARQAGGAPSAPGAGDMEVRSSVRKIDILGRAQRAARQATRQRAAAQEQAQQRLSQLVEVGVRLAQERERQALLDQLMRVACDMASCDTGWFTLRSDDDVLRVAASVGTPAEFRIDVPLRDASGAPRMGFMVTEVIWRGHTIRVDDIDTETRYDMGRARTTNRRLERPMRAVLGIPLYASTGRVIGTFMLVRTGHDASAFEPDCIPPLESLASQAAIAIENQDLLVAQRELTQALIRVLASAIDAKSGYTGGHCERVPELAFMLAEEATKADTGPLADFGFRSEDEWREFRTGAWLHDCGKVTSPEHVMDKATKLEMVHNRIHEVRMRFEVLLRDARIAAWEAIAAGAHRQQAWGDCAAQERQLQEEFAFIAQCNIGGEFLAPEDMRRIHVIAQRTWWRHFDDSLGLSWAERERHAQDACGPLPVQEALLADKASHRIPRTVPVVQGEAFGLAMQVPEWLYDHGEIYNLCISRGTLNAEERFKVNEHIIQTIRMLETIPWTANLKRVPEYAGTHHETLTGTGYPRRLNASQLSIPSRIMAIADIFEALTAPDRPYKRAKTLSEAIHILHRFKRDQHIDPELFDLFLSSGIYRRYAERFLGPEQIDEVDVGQYLDDRNALAWRATGPASQLGELAAP